MKGNRILVVDDERSMRDFLTIFLEREGLRVEAVSTAEQGLAAFGREPHDLVLTDLNLPGMTGMDLLKAIKTRTTRSAQDAPVIVITAYGTAESAVEATVGSEPSSTKMTCAEPPEAIRSL